MTDDTKREHDRDIATLKAEVKAVLSTQERDQEMIAGVRERGHANSNAIQELQIGAERLGGRVERVEEHQERGSERMAKIETHVDELRRAHWRAAGIVAGVSGACAILGGLLGKLLGL